MRGEESYISFTVHSEAVDGGFNGRVLADINDSQFTFAPDGSYEVVFSAEKPADPGANWVQLDPDARMLIVRSYFLREQSAQNDPLVAVRIGIETLDDVPPPPPLDDATLAARLQRRHRVPAPDARVGQGLPTAPSPAPFMGKEPNTVGEPWSFRNAGVDAAGAVDIFYSMGRWDLGPDDALVMRGTIPPSRFTNVMLWNRHMQTLEYVHRQSSLNSAQIAYEPDGSYTIVVSHRDPGVANWLDTGGHRVGTIFWRYLLPETDPTIAECEVVPVDSLATSAQARRRLPRRAPSTRRGRPASVSPITDTGACASRHCSPVVTISTARIAPVVSLLPCTYTPYGRATVDSRHG